MKTGDAPPTGVILRPARPEDLPEVLSLLTQAGLPAQGVAEAFAGFVVADAGIRIAGVAGLERYGNDGLLRSVAVASDWRGRRLGGALVQLVLRMARDGGFSSVYLLTETAEDFFPRYGFRVIERSSVPASIRTSAEFADLCPTSSTVMVWTPGSTLSPP